MDVAWAASIGGSREDKMDSELEALAVSLPLDLAHFVQNDNTTFQDEIQKWDRDQEIQKQQELSKFNIRNI